jgi:2-dehydro-3-deoxyphosphogluconate aldolase/(4S)-4-hydroxy-2-oxoglutarate aldolase
MHNMKWQVTPATVFATSPIMPVMVIHDAADAVPMAQALAAGGIHVFEITLRTPAALDAIRLIRAALPHALVGAGTVLNPQQFEQAKAAGAQFMISPGMTDALLAHGAHSDTALIPGVATPSEMMTALAYGYTHVKFFPAEANGGVPVLKAVSAPLPQLTFCPTGGIHSGNMLNYLTLDNVPVIGGSWMLNAGVLAKKDWAAVTAECHASLQKIRQVQQR